MKSESAWEDHKELPKKWKHCEPVDKGYSPKYDAYYNVKTGEWLEEACGHEDCEFCKDRPEKYIRPTA